MQIRNLTALTDAEFLAASIACWVRCYERQTAQPSLANQAAAEFWLEHVQAVAAGF